MWVSVTPVVRIVQIHIGVSARLGLICPKNVIEKIWLLVTLYEEASVAEI